MRILLLFLLLYILFCYSVSGYQDQILRHKFTKVTRLALLLSQLQHQFQANSFPSSTIFLRFKLNLIIGMHSFLDYRKHTLNTIFPFSFRNPGFPIINLDLEPFGKNIMDPDSICRNLYELKCLVWNLSIALVKLTFFHSIPMELGRQNTKIMTESRCEPWNCILTIFPPYILKNEDSNIPLSIIEDVLY